MRVLIIGNSHGSALQLALRTGWSRSNTEIDIIVIPGRNEPQMVRRGDRLFPKGNLGKMRSSIDNVRRVGINVRDYNRVWLVGFGISGPNHAMLMSGEHPISRAFCSTWTTEPTLVSPISRAHMADIIRGNVTHTGAAALLRDLSDLDEQKVAVQLRPRPAAHFLEDPGNQISVLYSEGARAVIQQFFDLHEHIAFEEAGKAAPQALVFSQPSETLVDGLTKTSFSKLGDMLHMNAEFGALILSTLYATTIA